MVHFLGSLQDHFSDTQMSVNRLQSEKLHLGVQRVVLKGVCAIPSGKEPENQAFRYPFGGSKYESDKKQHVECAFLELS